MMGWWSNLIGRKGFFITGGCYKGWFVLVLGGLGCVRYDVEGGVFSY